MASVATADNHVVAPDADPRGISGWIIALLALAMFVNYADRGSLAVAAPLLSRELVLGPAAMGVLLSSFFWTYSLIQPVSGAIAQTWPIRRVMAGALIAWSIATVLCGLATGFYALLALRMLVGVGESVIYPANARFVSEHARVDQRGFANGAISASMFMGPVAGTLIGGLVLASHGWRAVFIVLGMASLIWLVPWFATRLPADRDAIVGTSGATLPGWRDIIGQPRFWGVAIGHLFYCYPSYLLLTWLPSFLVNAQHYTLAQMAVMGAVVPGFSAIGSMISGIGSDRAVAAGIDETRIRKGFMQGGMAITGLSLLGATFAPDGVPVVACLSVTALCCGIMSPMSFTAGQMLAGPGAAARWMGLQNLVGNLGGIAAPMITGFVVAGTGSYRMAFLIPAVTTLIGLFAWGPLMGDLRPIAWRDRD